MLHLVLCLLMNFHFLLQLRSSFIYLVSSCSYLLSERAEVRYHCEIDIMSSPTCISQYTVSGEKFNDNADYLLWYYVARRANIVF